MRSKRVRLVAGLLLAWGSLVAARLSWLQLANFPAKERAKRQFVARVTLWPMRGALLDRYGRPLALDVPGITLYQDRERVEDPTGILRELGIKPKKLGNKKAILLARNLPLRYEARLRKVKGTFIRKGWVRSYPLGKAGAALVGKVGYDGKGLWGLELSLNEELAGEPGYELYMRTADGKFLSVPGLGKNEPVDGPNLRLTLDGELLVFCYETIKKKVIEEGANWGFVIVTRPYTGEILAIAQYPVVDRVLALTDPYEPGSTFKPFVMAAALESGKVNLDDTVRLPPRLRVGRHQIGDITRRNKMTWAGAIVYSSNRAMATLGLRLGPRPMWEMARRLGFGAKTDICLPGEWANPLPSPKRWSRPIETANLAMGQGIMVTGIQMAMAWGALANGGLLLAPRLLGSRPIIIRRAIPERVVALLRPVLVRVVEEGSGRAARIPGVRVAGKTGTAQKAGPGGYSHDRVVASFVGFFPAEAPEYLIYVVVDEPKEHKLGGQVAAPVFREIALYLLGRVQA